MDENLANGFRSKKAGTFLPFGVEKGAAKFLRSLISFHKRRIKFILL